MRQGRVVGRRFRSRHGPHRRCEFHRSIRAIARKRLAGVPLAVCVVADVYRGMAGIQRGEVKYIRINEQVPRPWAARRKWDFHAFHQQHSQVSATNLGLKVQWGIVPVEEDGSAHFYVPADRNVFFQALDGDYQELQRERTYVNYRPGEIRSCVGCHETPQDNGGGVVKSGGASPATVDARSAAGRDERAAMPGLRS